MSDITLGIIGGGQLGSMLAISAKKLNIKTPSIEGSNDSGWVVIDSGDVIVHLFKDEIRKFYNLENMWSTEIE